MATRKDVTIQSLRGLAVVLMVAGHVIGSDGTRGLTVPDHSVWRLSYLALEDLRMPLFTMISGFVYAFRPVPTWAGYHRLVSGKTRRLLVPLLTVGPLLFALKLLVPGVNARPDPSDAWRIFLFPFQHLWFLQALFLVFALVGALEVTRVLRRHRSWALALAAACVVHLVLVVPAAADVFSINGAARLLPFFLLGLGLHRFGDGLARQRWASVVLPAFAVVLGLRLTLIFTDAHVPTPALRILSLAVGLSGLVSVFLLRERLTSATLAWIGAFSFGIYLFHVFAAAGMRLALERAGVHSTPVLFLVCLIAGIGAPILFELAFGRFAVVSWGLLGQKPASRVAAVPAPVVPSQPGAPELERDRAPARD